MEIDRFGIEDKELRNQVIFTHLSEIVLEAKFNQKAKEYELPTDINVLQKVYPYINNNKLVKEFSITKKIKQQILESIDQTPIRDIIGVLYENNISIEKRKDIGQFYTRASDIIDYMLDNLNYRDSEMINRKIIDPASGSGLFLINSAKRLSKYMKLNGYANIEILNEISSNIHGIDIDLTACYLTELNLLIELMDIIILAYKEDSNFVMNKFNILNGDFIKVPYKEEQQTLIKYIDEVASELHSELDDIKTLSNNYHAGFDYIVSNPPYITMYGRRSRNMTEEKRQYFNKNYDFVETKNGNNKFNSIMFFIERSIKMLRQNQKLCYIIDMAFFETAFRDIRKYILDTCKINKLTVNLKEFENVASGQVIIELIKENNKEERDCNIVSWIDEFEGNVLKIKQLDWYVKANEFKFSKPLKGYESSIISKLENNKTLLDYFPDKQLRTCCALTGKSEEFMVNNEEFINDKNDLVFPYLEGSKGLSNKFGKLTPTNYFKYDYDLQQKISEEFKVELEKLGVKNKKRIAIGDRDSYLSPKMFIRQSATELIVTYTEEKFASNNSIYILTNKINTTENRQFLKYVCGLLNSNLLTYFARVKRVIRMGNGKTPQIKLADLKTVPLKVTIGESYEKLILLVEQLLLSSGMDDLLLIELNSLVYSIYGIKNDEILFIENELKSISKG